MMGLLEEYRAQGKTIRELQETWQQCFRSSLLVGCDRSLKEYDKYSELGDNLLSKIQI